MKLADTYNLKAIFPEVARQWNPTKNGKLTPDKVTPNSPKKVWWLCARCHEWQARIAKRSKRGDGCPQCSSRTATRRHNLLILNPDIAFQWHPFKNGDLTPDKVTPVSWKKVWWLCDKGHEWIDRIKERVNGNTCPYCFGIDAIKEYNLSSYHPAVAAQWHPTKNSGLTPEDVTPGSTKKVWWVCEKGHEWKTSIANRSYGSGCHYCAGLIASKENNLLKVYPDIARQWHPTKNGKLSPEKVTSGTDKKVWWRCDKGHEWIASIACRSAGTSCP